ncbi:MAG: hypothetical protein PQJ59_14345 [Spirochaetales bacterium]|nr:hypothetical protein [Spirochaetales bacterium]
MLPIKFFAFVLGLFLSLSALGYARGKVVLFSPVKGTLTLNGEPLAGVKISRVYSRPASEKDRSDAVYTDGEGNFSFDVATGRLGIMRFLPHEAVIFQSLTAEYLGEEYLIWYHCKRDYHLMGELKGYLHEPVLPPEMESAYKEGYLLIQADLKRREEAGQLVNSRSTIYSIADFRFPYDLALKALSEEVKRREAEFAREIGAWFEENPDFIARKIEKESWSEWELEKLEAYGDARIVGVSSVDIHEYADLPFFEEDYGLDRQRVELGGGVIVDLGGPEGEARRARVWLSAARFWMSEDEVSLDSEYCYWGINASNIEPDVVE